MTRMARSDGDGRVQGASDTALPRTTTITRETAMQGHVTRNGSRCSKERPGCPAPDPDVGLPPGSKPHDLRPNQAYRQSSPLPRSGHCLSLQGYQDEAGVDKPLRGILVHDQQRPSAKCLRVAAKRSLSERVRSRSSWATLNPSGQTQVERPGSSCRTGGGCNNDPNANDRSAGAAVDRPHRG